MTPPAVVRRPTALLVEDEPFPRAQLRELLAASWPTLEIVAEAADGLEGLRLLNDHRPDIAFIDIRLPGLDGLQLARSAAGRCHVVFVTAFDQHALAAFDEGAVDYLLKPISAPRLAATVDRLQQRLWRPPADPSALLQRFGQGNAGAGSPAPSPLRWLQVGNGSQLRLVMVSDVAYFQSEDKYTRLVGTAVNDLVRLSVKELAARLDPELFCQIHRGCIVNLASIAVVRRNALGHMHVELKGRDERLTVSQSFQGRFRVM